MNKLCYTPLLILLSVFIAGCNKAEGVDPNLVSVTGTVTLDGNDVPSGDITFIPEEGSEGKQVTGVIEDGEYELKTSKSAPGALPGKYKVIIVSKKSSPGMDESGKPIPEEWLVPEKYSKVNESGLTAEVKKGEANEIPFKLTTN